MGQQRSARGARRGHDEKEERDAHRTPAEIDDSGQPPEESGRDERDSDQQDRLRDDSPNGADRFVKTRVIAGTSPRPSTYRRAKAITALRVSPLRMEVIGTTAIAGGTAAMRTQPFRI